MEPSVIDSIYFDITTQTYDGSWTGWDTSSAFMAWLRAPKNEHTAFLGTDVWLFTQRCGICPELTFC